MAFVWREEKKLICDCFLFFHKFSVLLLLSNKMVLFVSFVWHRLCVYVLFCTTWLSINSHCVLRNFVLLLFSFDLIWIFDLNYLSYWMQAIKTSCILQQYYVRWNKKYTDFTAITHKKFFSLCFHSHWILQFQIKIFFFENQYALYALRYIHHNHINWMTIFFLCWMCLLLMMICCLSWNFSFTLDIIMSFFFRFALLNSHHSKFSVALYVFVCTSVYRRL